MSLEQPPNSLSQANLDASNKSPVYVAIAIGFALATGGVILRGLARCKSKAAFGWDDYSIIVALVLLYALDVSGFLAIKYGLGRHLPAVLSTVVAFQKVSIVTLVLWLATATATKASLLLLYYRLFSPSKRFRLAVRIGAAIIFSQWFIFTFATIFQCRPVAAFWNRNIQGAKCIDLALLSLVSGVLNLLTDVLLLCLPIPMVWGLNTTKAQKITLTGIFLLGTFVCAISIIRISKLTTVSCDDPTWVVVSVNVWTILENSVGITSACLPTMRPLFGRFIPETSRAESCKKNSNGASSQRAVKAQFNRLSEESGTENMTQSVIEGAEDAWTSPDLVASSELPSMNKAPTRPLYPTDSSSRIKDQHHRANYTWRATYE